MGPEDNPADDDPHHECAAEIDRLRDALSRIQWVKDCGIDGKDSDGKWVNFTAEERDVMYRIATETIGLSRHAKECGYDSSGNIPAEGKT